MNRGFVFSLENHTAFAGKAKILDGVSLAVRQGERIVLAGPNGAGKTSLLRVIALCARTSGARPVFAPQDIPADCGLSGREFVMLGRTAGLKPFRRPSPADFAAVDAALAALGAEHLADRPAGAASGGEKQLLAVALAVASGAPAVLLDEPSAHLDMVRAAEFSRLLEMLAERRPGLAVVAAVHDFENASGAFTRAVLMSAGRIVRDGTPEEVFTQENLSAAYGVRVWRATRTAWRAGAASCRNAGFERL